MVNDRRWTELYSGVRVLHNAQKSAVRLTRRFCSRIGEQKRETSADQTAQNV